MKIIIISITLLFCGCIGLEKKLEKLTARSTVQDVVELLGVPYSFTTQEDALKDSAKSGISSTIVGDLVYNYRINDKEIEVYFESGFVMMLIANGKVTHYNTSIPAL